VETSKKGGGGIREKDGEGESKENILYELYMLINKLLKNFKSKVTRSISVYEMLVLKQI
jgi:hypothetical protein